MRYKGTAEALRAWRRAMSDSALRAWGRTIPAEEWKRKVIATYRRNSSLRAAADILGISHVRVLAILREEGEKVNPPGRAKKVGVK